MTKLMILLALLGWILKTNPQLWGTVIVLVLSVGGVFGHRAERAVLGLLRGIEWVLQWIESKWD
jgi:hypothetical protein